MSNIKSWLDQQIANQETPTPIVVKVRHDTEKINTLTKKQLIAYAKEHGIAINSRKKREELIEIIIRS
jgi:hypothetical protein